VRIAGIPVDFRGILREFDLTTWLIDLSTFQKISGQNSLYRRHNNQSSIIVKSIRLSESVRKREIQNEIENLINLRHPCITDPIGFVLPTRSRELKIARRYGENGSLTEVLLANPEWWTPTVKAKSVLGIVLGLQFAHSFGLLHGRLTTNNILFDEDHCIQIADFGPIRLEGAGVGGFSGTEWTPKVDIHAFISLLSEIVNASGVYETAVSQRIEEGMEKKSKVVNSFCDIWRILKEDNFDILPGVHFEEVSAYVDEIESRE
jgi:serine/threonine protein kinase